jgi:hypothetical protein
MLDSCVAMSTFMAMMRALMLVNGMSKGGRHLGKSRQTITVNSIVERVPTTEPRKATSGNHQRLSKIISGKPLMFM